MKNQWVGVIEIFARYWRYYGGWKSILTSPYAAIAFIISLIGIPRSNTSTDWLRDASSVSSSLLGFSFAAYAILLAFGNEGFLQLMAKKREGQTSTYTRINAAFVHFIVLQLISLLLCNICISLLSASWDEDLLNLIIAKIPFCQQINALLVTTNTGLWFVYFVYIYSITLALASVMAVFRLSDVYGKYLEKTAHRKEKSAKED